MPEPGHKKTVLRVLESLRGLDDLKQLFWTELNYERENTPLSDRGWSDAARNSLAEVPLLLAGGGSGSDFHVIYNRLKSEDLPRSLERLVVNQLLKDHPYALLVFSDERQTCWHFLNVKYDDDVNKRRIFRRITVRPGDGLRTAAERIAMLDLESIGSDLFGLSPLAIQARHDEAFDVEKVTKDFYKELANWYFWALRHVRFPKDAPKEADGHDHIAVIRMITRLIFCWFVKEKGLIPGGLFDQRRLDELLDGFAPEKDTYKESVFYKAILQNLFFATLNTEMDKRGWVKDEQNFMAHSLYRYRDLFQKPGEALALFKNVPFLNGGLFECLDKDLGENTKPRYMRIDGFSRRSDSQPVVPDFLFFGSEREEDLSADYGDRKFRKVRVRGLIHTLNRYRFTIEENTPIEQEVALDPELSGKVFENLLAAYNPETGATARKQTGSFYTPREIVDYMVDEALIAFLKGGLPVEDEKVTEEKLRRLASWEESGHDFDDRETESLITAIDGLKALDPAVGSGAFPMGILHKLVFILSKLDPHNKQWEERQIQRVRDAVATAEKIEDAAIRERTVRELEQQITSIEEAFERNELDYGRKLYLIENCLYGVDIQTIAVQIAKMRFFISLIVDQRMDPDAPNLGVRPLPNLETKFVAANTLIGIEKPKQATFRNPDIDVKEVELHKVREKHFNARTPTTKEKYREQDKKLRAEIADLLKRDGWGDTTARQLAAWDPYDQNASAPFFDPEWMFGIREGFDVVIGNPPYGIDFLSREREILIQCYPQARKIPDSYCFFILKGFELLREDACLSFIVPNTFCDLENGEQFRKFLLECKTLARIWQSGWAFETAVVDTLVFFGLNSKPNSDLTMGITVDEQAYERRITDFLKNSLAKIDYRNPPLKGELLRKIERQSIFLGAIADVKAGVKMYEKGKGDPPQTDQIVADRPYSVNGKCPRGWMPLYRGSDIDRFVLRPATEFVHYGPWLAAPRNPMLFISPKILMRRTDDRLKSCIETEAGICVNSCHVIKRKLGVKAKFSYEFILGILNSRLIQWVFELENPQMVGKVFAEIKVIYVERLPLPDCAPKQQQCIDRLITRILAEKKIDSTADTSMLEGEIDRMVYELYGLTVEEIAIVEGASG